MLDPDEQQALANAKAYNAAKAEKQMKDLRETDKSSLPPDAPGVHITSNHREALSKYCDEGLWSLEEALCTRSALVRWKHSLQMSDLVEHSLVCEGLTRLIRTGTDSEETLLQQIMSGSKYARISPAELEEAGNNHIGIFALSYRHQGKKGQNITSELWKDVLMVSNALAACAGYQYYTLWIDTVSAAAKGEKQIASYVDWFTIGVAPYLLLPTVLMASEADRTERMWLRLEEKLSQYGQCTIYALRHHGGIVRIEPGPLEVRTQAERLWCLCKSVVRGEYNRLETSFKKDYRNLLKWAIEFEARPVDYRGLESIFGRECDYSFRAELPIEKGCYILQEPLHPTGWLHGAEAAAGRLEYLTMTGNEMSVQGVKDEAKRSNRGHNMVLITLQTGRKLCLQQCKTREGKNHINRRRWRSYADSTLLIAEIQHFHRDSKTERVSRTILTGPAFPDWDCMNWDFRGEYGLEVIPAEVRTLLGTEKTVVQSVEKITDLQFSTSLAS